MKLGQKVKFEKYLKKKPYCNWYKGKPKEIGESYLKYDTIELDDEKQGVFCGTRTISYRGYTDNEYGNLTHTSLEKKNICLIACNTRGFYRVPEKWLQEVENDKS